MGKFRKALQALWSQTTNHGKEKIKLAGQDNLGNKYFEAYRPHSERKIHRYFENPKIDSFETIVDAARVPPCWDAWLRFRRQQPPTQEELEDSEEYYQMQQKMHTERKMKEESEKKEENEPKEQNTFCPVTPGDMTNRARTVPPGYYEHLKK